MPDYSEDLSPEDLVAALSDTLLSRGQKVVTAESCTGGLLAAYITARPGSSNVFERGFITYSNAAKMDLLDVPATILDTKGAVSEDCARAMAQGALKDSRGDIAVSITGVAGPGGGSADKPVGMVCFGLANRDGRSQTVTRIFQGERVSVRMQSVQAALILVQDHLLQIEEQEK